MTKVAASAGSRSRAFKRLVLPAPRKPVTTVSGKGAGGLFCRGVIGGGTASKTQLKAHRLACFSGVLLFVLPACAVTFTGKCAVLASFAAIFECLGTLALAKL